MQAAIFVEKRHHLELSALTFEPAPALKNIDTSFQVNLLFLLNILRVLLTKLRNSNSSVTMKVR